MNQMMTSKWNKRQICICFLKALFALCFFAFFYWNFKAGNIGTLAKRQLPPVTPFVAFFFTALSAFIWMFGGRLLLSLCGGKTSQKLKIAYHIFLCILPFLFFLLAEMPWNTYLLRYDPLRVLFNYALFLLFELFFFFLLRDSRPGLSLLAVISFVIGAGNYYVLKFRGSPILAADITAFSTAASVAGDYTFEIGDGIARALLLLFLVLSILSAFHETGVTRAEWKFQLSLKRIKDKKLTPYKTVRILRPLVSLAAACSFVICLFYGNFAGNFAVPVNMYVPLITYREVGFVPGFMSFFQKMRIAKPEGYSQDKVEEILEPYTSDTIRAAKPQTTAPAAASTLSHSDSAEKKEEKPTVIAIMNESFSDLNTVGPLSCTAEHLSFLKSLKDDPGTVEYGWNYVSTIGGGTSTTEFEFLTGNSMAELQGTNPYGAFTFDGKPSFVQVYKEQGYSAIAMHPENPNNWRRSTVYPALGFDQFLSIDSFAGYEKTVRDRISDRGDYEKLLRVAADTDGPLFLFNVTMQNHGEYDLNLIPADERVQVDETYASYQDFAAYESLIHQSDEALSYLIDELRKLDRPVLLCFFGDHQPNLNDELEQKLSDAGKQENEPALITEERRYMVPYFIWSNYGVTPQDVAKDASGTDISSTNYLGARVQAYAGLSLSSYGKYLLTQRSQMPVFNKLGFYGNDGAWHTFDDAPEAYAPWISHYNIVEYNALFDKKRDEEFYSLRASLDKKTSNG